MNVSWVRLIVAIGVLFSCGILALHAKKRERSFVVYVGTYTGATSKGIYSFRFDTATGKVSTPQLAAETENPSFLAADPARHLLFAVNEVSDFNVQKSGAISAFSIGAETGALKFIDQISSAGAGPCYVSVDKTGKYVMVANYDSGSVAVFPVLDDGKLGGPTATVQHTGHGTDPDRQSSPHAHQIEVSPDNRFAVAADLGLDKLLVYHFDPNKGTLGTNSPAFAEVGAGSGPRHFAFTPNGKFLYVLEEMRSAVTAFAYNAESGTLKPLQTLATIPREFKGTTNAAEITVDPAGKFVYASNRGHDSIAIFAIGTDGTLSNIAYVPTQGKTPRGFQIDPTGSYLFVGNQESDNIVVFRIDHKTGRLKSTGTVVQVPKPVSIEFVESE